MTIDRIGLGEAVTLEFLGPLTIALAGSHRRVDLGCAVLAAAGVVALMRPRPTADYLGMGLALLAGDDDDDEWVGPRPTRGTNHPKKR
ncbi:threonine/homoserine efflux transporter RhtA [Catenulispora sp. GAS73]